MTEKKRRVIIAFLLAGAITIGVAFDSLRQQVTDEPSDLPAQVVQQEENTEGQTLASEALGRLAIKGRAPKTGYTRAQFYEGWATTGGCDLRNLILQRDLTDTMLQEDNCTVQAGTLHDPYTGTRLQFTRGQGTSQAVQIDHVVALSDAWQKGAQQLSATLRAQFSNDPLNLLAADGPANQKKGDGDAATWLPANKPYRCPYVARQIAVKTKYELWVTQAEHDAMHRVLNTCPHQPLPIVGGTNETRD